MSSEDKDALIQALLEKTKSLESTVSLLEEKISEDEANKTTYYASHLARQSESELNTVPEQSHPARFVKNLVRADVIYLFICFLPFA